MAEYRRQGNALSFMMQVDAEAASFDDLKPGESRRASARRGERFLRLSAEAGCLLGFVGFETFNPQKPARRDQGAEPREGARQRKDGADVRPRSRRSKENTAACAATGTARAWRALRLHDRLSLRRPGEGRQSAEWLLEVGVDLASFSS